MRAPRLHLVCSRRRLAHTPPWPGGCADLCPPLCDRACAWRFSSFRSKSLSPLKLILHALPANEHAFCTIHSRPAEASCCGSMDRPGRAEEYGSCEHYELFPYEPAANPAKAGSAGTATKALTLVWALAALAMVSFIAGAGAGSWPASPRGQGVDRVARQCGQAKRCLTCTGYLPVCRSLLFGGGGGHRTEHLLAAAAGRGHHAQARAVL